MRIASVDELDESGARHSVRLPALGERHFLLCDVSVPAELGFLDTSYKACPGAFMGAWKCDSLVKVGHCGGYCNELRDGSPLS